MITANDLKVKGIKAIEKELQERDEAVITFRGKPKYIVLDIEEYETMRSLQIEAAYKELKKKKEQGKAYISDADTLIQRIENEL